MYTKDLIIIVVIDAEYKCFVLFTALVSVDPSSKDAINPSQNITVDLFIGLHDNYETKLFRKCIRIDQATRSDLSLHPITSNNDSTFRFGKRDVIRIVL